MILDVLTLISPLWHDGCCGSCRKIPTERLYHTIMVHPSTSPYHFIWNRPTTTEQLHQRLWILIWVPLLPNRIYMIGLSIWIEWQLCSFKLLMKCFFLKIYFDRSSRLSYRMTWMFGWVILYSSRPSCTSCTTGGPAVVTCHQLSILFYFWIRRSWIVTVRVSRRLLSSRMTTSTTWF